jgi:TolB-like protein
VAEEGTERRLAAIMSADVAGYSRLMGKDETGTLSALKLLRKHVFAPQVAAHKGRVVKLMGDGALVEFPSIVNAVNCAIAVQRVLAERPAEEPIKLRIGINLGDIIIEGDDIYGDGVNVAARIQEAAEPGGVALSGSAFDHVSGKVEATFEDAGEHELKNIAKPVRVWRWIDGFGAATGLAEPLALPDKPSIAVLPFTNMSGDPEQEYFSDGITEDIITELSRFRSLFVIARNSSFTFKGQSVDVSEVGRKLGVDYVVEGSVRKVGNRVRITAQLVEAATGNHLWAERYDRDLDDIFAVQDEVVATIAAVLPGRVDDARVAHSRLTPTDSLPAYDCILRGNKHLRAYRRHEIAKARAAFERAVELDPNSARARAGVAFTYLWEYFWDDFDARRPALDHAERAVVIDQDEPEALHALGLALAKNGRPDEAVRILERAVALVPASVEMATMLGVSLVHAGRHDEALEVLQASSRLGLFQLDWAHEFTGQAYYFQHRFGEAVAAFERIVDPPSWIHAFLAASFANDGNDESATEQVAALARSLSREHGKQGDVADAIELFVKDIKLYKRPEDRQFMIDGFRKAGLPV